MSPMDPRAGAAGLKVNEIFLSIQGESLHAGRPCVFVRLAGCNLRCAYCDTRHAWFEGRQTGIEEIVSRVMDYGVPLVEITGGEPLLQSQTPALARRLLDAGLEVMVETNGSLPIDRISAECIRVMDIKCPGSGQGDKTDFDNIGRLGPKDQVKFVVCDRADYDFARAVIERHWNGKPPVPVLISPAAETVAPATVAAWILEDRIDVRLQLQLHKILWPGIERGV